MISPHPETAKPVELSSVKSVEAKTLYVFMKELETPLRAMWVNVDRGKVRSDDG